MPEPADASLTDLLACQIDAYRALNPGVTVQEVLQALETIRHKLTEELLNTSFRLNAEKRPRMGE